MRTLLVLLAVAGCSPGDPDLSNEALQGAWSYHDGHLRSDPDSAGVMAYQAVSIRADSIRLLAGVRTPWRRYVVAGDSLHVEGLGSIAATLVGDTLRLAGILHVAFEEALEQAFVRLDSDLGAPRPERIALSAGYCYGLCPSFDVEIDSFGAVRYHGRSEDGLEGDHVSSGHRSLFLRLAETAAAVRADTTRRSYYGFEDDHELALLAWYDGRVVVHDGTAHGLDRLLILAADLADVAETVPLRPSTDSLEFEGREHIYLSDETVDSQIIEEIDRVIEELGHEHLIPPPPPTPG